MLQSCCAEPILEAVSNQKASPTVALRRYGKEVSMRTIHVYRAACDYCVDGIYWGDDAEGVLLSLRAKGVPPDAMTQALEQLDQAGTPIIQQE